MTDYEVTIETRTIRTYKVSNVRDAKEAREIARGWALDKDVQDTYMESGVEEHVTSATARRLDVE